MSFFESGASNESMAMSDRLWPYHAPKKWICFFGFLLHLASTASTAFVVVSNKAFVRPLYGTKDGAIRPTRVLRYSSDVNGLERSLNTTSTTVSSMDREDTSEDEINMGRPLPTKQGGWTSDRNSFVKPAVGTLGDIMSSGNEDMVTSTYKGNLSASLDRRDGLVTSALRSGSLANRFGIKHPLDRMALTANGNLQRLVSSYYDSPVQVLVDYCCLLEDPDKISPFQTSIPSAPASQPMKWDRLVHLTVHNQTFCRAHSIITVFDPICQQLVESGEVGLGQLFRYLDILPEFTLHRAGPYPIETGGGFWREYSLKCAELSCDIHEDFRSGIWDLHPEGG